MEKVGEYNELWNCKVENWIVCDVEMWHKRLYVEK